MQCWTSAPLFDAAALELLKWTAEYYHHPLGEVVAAALPKALRDGAPLEPCSEFLVCNADGAAALAAGEPRRAPQQRALLERIAGHAGGVPAEALTAALPAWRNTARALIARGWAAFEARAVVAAAAGQPSAAVAAPDVPTLTPEQSAAVAAITTAAGALRRLPAAGRDRQRQDRGVPAPGGARAGARAQRRWCWCRRSA